MHAIQRVFAGIGDRTFGRRRPRHVLMASCVILAAGLCLAAGKPETPAGSGAPAQPAAKTDTAKADTGTVDRSDSVASSKVAATTDTVRGAAYVPPAVAKSGQSRTHLADSTRLDSLTRKAVRDSLTRVRDSLSLAYNKTFLRDSVVAHSGIISQSQAFLSDATGMMDVLRSSAYVVSIPFTLSSVLNRSLVLGLPAPRSDLFGNAPLALDGRGALESLGPSEVRSVTVDPSGGVSVTSQPDDLVSPVTLLLWENGVFGESTLGVLFARPVAARTSLAVFTNYRHYDAQRFSHSAGNIGGIYSSLPTDSTLIVDEGRNPLVNEMVSGVRAVWLGDHGLAVRLSYRYLDLLDEAAYVRPASGGSSASEAWASVWQFCHAIDVGVDRVATGPLLSSVNGFLRSEVLTDVRGASAGGYGGSRQRGTSTWSGAGVRTSLPFFGRDTVSLCYNGRFENRELYDGEQWNLRANRAWLRLDVPFALGAFAGSLLGEGGHDFRGAKDSSGHVWVWNAVARASFPVGTASVYGRGDVEAYTPPLDTTIVVPGRVLDPYVTCGADIWLGWRKVGVLAGYCYTEGVDSATLIHAWPGGILPYAEPHSVVTLCPTVGTLWGLSLFSRWMFSDTKPVVKSFSGLSYETTVANGNEHIRLDLTLDYWSKRDSIAYAGTSKWGREIWDLAFKTSVQIKSFRLFYKMDNVLNRQNAYVPGYMMPGLVFRWGFDWFLER
jgi:hypothetical protein